MGFAGIGYRQISTNLLADQAVTQPKIATPGVKTANLATSTYQFYRYLGPLPLRDARSNVQNAVAGRVYLTPFTVPRSMTFDRAVIPIDSGSVFGNTRFALYNDNGDQPGSLVSQSDSGPMTVASPTVIAFSRQITLAQGLYWMAIMFDDPGAGFERAFAANIYPATTKLNGCFFANSGGFGAFPANVPALTADSTASHLTVIRVASLNA